ncbi:glycosyltransferase [Granulicoccus sp. GXG6511]|uniref:glycosyltransferase n=1 Tax=Granulicoccus sp. GXG6511 TaxID=3381351 RepID=UPI003D7C9765
MTPAIVFVALGSRGDVEPMARLAGALGRRGAVVRVVALKEYAGLAAQQDVPFVPVDASLAEILTTAGRLRRFASTSGGQGWLLNRWARHVAEPATDAVLSAVQPGDTVLSGVLGAGVGPTLAEERGCPVATIAFSGQFPTLHRESHYFAHGFRRWEAYNRWGVNLNWSLVTAVGAPVTKALRARLGRPAWRTHQIRDAVDAHPRVVAASPVLIPPASDWPAGVHQTGFLFAPDPDARLDPELELFLADGPPPVFIGMGSMTGATGREGFDLAIAAGRAAGRRVVVPAPDPGPSGRVAEDAYAITDAPHDLLFPQMAGLIHHGGAGTTQMGLRSGRPTVAAPFAADQPYHAWRLHRLGLGPEPVPFLRLTPERLARLTNDLVAGPDTAGFERRAADVRTRICAEDGIGQTIALLSQLELLPA